MEYDHWLIPKFSTIPQGSRITPERVEKMLVGDSMQMKEKELLLSCLYNREAAFAWNFSEIGQIRPEVTPPMEIRTVPHEAWQAAGFPIPKALQGTVIEMLRERMNAGLLERCHGPYRNPWFLVKKKSNKYRMVNAAMNINRVTIRDANLPPQVDAFAEEFAGMQMTSLIDFFSGYDQLSFDKRSRDLTAFMTPLGLLRMTTLPQGATNSVGQFVRVANHILDAHIPEKCQTFVDDVAVKGDRDDHENKEVVPGIRIFVLRHIQNLDKVLADIERSGATISGEKSQFCMSGIKIVGFVCDGAGRHPDSVKVIKIIEWEDCRDVTAARAFMGICTYYRIWVENYAVVAEPIYRLLRKDEPFVWNDEQREAMYSLKMVLTRAPALRAIDYFENADDIILAVDASNAGWGAVLMQKHKGKRHPNRYESGLWADAERKYDSGKRECRELLKALKKVRFWLYEVHFVVEIDANTLVAQLNQSAADLPGALVTRWLAWIRLFDFDVRHVPGKKHGAADGLSRRPRTASDDIDEANEVDIDDFIDAEMNCVRVASVRVTAANERVLLPEYSDESERIAVWLTTLSRPANMDTKQFLKFKMHALKHLVREKHLFRRMNKNVPMRRVVDDRATKTQILEAMHEESGHRGKEGTYQKIAARYFWPEIMRDVKNHLKTCDPCQRRAAPREEEALHPIWTNVLWQKVCVDIVHMQPSEGKHYLVLAREDLSGWVEGRALAKADSESVARFIYEDIICRHGCFGRLVIDGGPENKKLVETLTQKYRIKRLIVSAFHPQANGMVERGHTPVKDALSKLTLGGEGRWTRHLHSVLWADRTTIRRSTGMTPLRVTTGTEAVLPIELNVPTWQTLPWGEVHTTADLLTLRARQIQRRDEDLEEAAMHLQRVRTEAKDLFDENHRTRTEDLREADMVMLHDTRLDNQHFERLAFRWLGPFRISQAFPQKGTYIIAELDGAELRGTVPGNRLKKFYPREAVNPETFSENEDPNAEFANPVLEDDQLYSDEEEFGYLVNEEDIPRTGIEVRIPASSG